MLSQLDNDDDDDVPLLGSIYILKNVTTTFTIKLSWFVIISIIFPLFLHNRGPFKGIPLKDGKITVKWQLKWQ